MQQFFPSSFNSFITMTSLIILCLHMFFLSNKNNRHLINTICIGNPIKFLKMRRLFQIVQYIINRCCINTQCLHRSRIDAQIGINLPYLLSKVFPQIILFVAFSFSIFSTYYMSFYIIYNITEYILCNLENMFINNLGYMFINKIMSIIIFNTEFNLLDQLQFGFALF